MHYDQVWCYDCDPVSQVPKDNGNMCYVTEEQPPLLQVAPILELQKKDINFCFLKILALACQNN